MALFVAVDIGCLECGETSQVLGVFTDRGAAETACADHEARQHAGWSGQHAFEVFEVPGVDVEVRQEYT